MNLEIDHTRRLILVSKSAWPQDAMVEPWTLGDYDSRAHTIYILFIVVAFLMFIFGGWMVIYIRKRWHEGVESGLYLVGTDDVAWNCKQAGRHCKERPRVAS